MDRGREYFNWGYCSWKTLLSVMFVLTFIFIGLHNSENLKRTALLTHTPRKLYDLSAEYGSKFYNNYQSRIHLARSKMELLKKGSISLENNAKEIMSLTKQIDAMKTLLQDLRNKMDNYVLNADDADVYGKMDELDATEEEMKLVDYILKKLREDKVQMADYALKSAGASIVESETSENYKNDKVKLSWNGIRFFRHEMPPDVILQPDVHPGKCWAFPGSMGHTTIKLAKKITPTAVTMEHISERISPSGSTASAPKDFSVYGIKDANEGGEEIFLGQFTYNNKKGITVQTFPLQNEVSGSLSYVKLKILNNWGHSKYTCLYRFRVHGKPENNGFGAS